jgi:hypothetical protein
LKPVFKAGTKGLRFGLEVGWAFVKPGVRLSRGGRMCSMIIPIPPINLSANVEAAYKKIRELRNKNELEKYLKERENTLTSLTDENGADIVDDYGNRLGEIEIELPDGSKQKVQVLINDADEALEKAGRKNGQLDGDGVNGAGNIIVKSWNEAVTAVDNIIVTKTSQLNNLFPNAKIGYRGSLSTGTKYSTGGPFDPTDWDVDAFIVSDNLATQIGGSGFRNGRDINAIEIIADELELSFKNISSYRTELNKPFTLRVWTEAEFNSIVKPNGYKLF